MFSNKNFIKNLLIAAAFIVLGLFMPGSTLTDMTAFIANITGISTGIGIGWLLKTFIEKKRAAETEAR
jgi:membrane associated rhomboid family serine protease